MNIYLSEFKYLDDNGGNLLYAKAVDAVLRFCKDNSINCYRSESFSGYEIIEKEIRDSHLLIAIIDEGWTSSTWKCHEYTFANGGTSMLNARNIGPIIPKISFVLPGFQTPEFVEKATTPFSPIRNINSLTSSINSAYRSIKEIKNSKDCVCGERHQEDTQAKDLTFNPLVDYGFGDMNEFKNLQYWKFGELIKCLILLSSEYNEQCKITRIGDVADEMAIDFETYYTEAKREYVKCGLITEDTQNKLEELDEFIEARSGSKNPNFWTDDALKENSDWNLIREYAKEILTSMGYQNLVIILNKSESIDSNGNLVSERVKFLLEERTQNRQIGNIFEKANRPNTFRSFAKWIQKFLPFKIPNNALQC